MIPAKTWYKTHDGELLVIVEVFKTWRYYLEGCKHKVLVLINYNNLRRFMDKKSLSSRQVCWAQKLSRYHFQIDYCQSKANGTADALSRFSQRNQAKKTNYEPKTLRFFINCNFHWPIPASQVSFTQPNYCHSTESSSAARTFYLSYVSFGTHFESNWVMRAHIELALVLYIWGSQNCGN